MVLMLGNRAVPRCVEISTALHAHAVEERGQLLPITQGEWGPQRVGGRSAREPFEQCHLVRIGLRPLEGLPHRHRHAAARRQDPRHLPKRPGAIPEEHQAELADDRVERGVREGQGLGRPFPPLDGRSQPLGHREHPPPGVQARHRPFAPHAPGRLPGQDPGAAGHVQHPLARPELRRLRDARGPLPEQRRHVELLVGGRRRDLPWRCAVAHLLLLVTCPQGLRAQRTSGP